MYYAFISFNTEFTNKLSSILNHKNTQKLIIKLILKKLNTLNLIVIQHIHT